MIGGFDANASRDAQFALIAAAKDARVKRCAQSEYALSMYDGLDFYAGKKVVWDALKESGLEYTRFSCGACMDMFGTRTPREEAEATAGMRS